LTGDLDAGSPVGGIRVTEQKVGGLQENMSMTTGGGRDRGAEKTGFEDQVDRLFKLPLTEFTKARNALASQLKQAGRAEESAGVKALAKPSIAAWTVNQLYWEHPAAFRKLMAAGERIGRAQASEFAGKDADVRGALAARREALSTLSREAEAILGSAGHNASPDTMRRITGTLEALSASTPSSGAPRPGRLTQDLAPPGFESLAALIPEGAVPKRPAGTPRPALVQPSPKRGAGKGGQRNEAGIAEARTELQTAERALREARAKADRTEGERRAAAERLEKATLAARQAREALESMTAEAERAARIVSDAERRLERARKELDAKTGVRS
jgi:hypothetical protein